MAGGKRFSWGDISIVAVAVLLLIGVVVQADDYFTSQTQRIMRSNAVHAGQIKSRLKTIEELLKEARK